MKTIKYFEEFCVVYREGGNDSLLEITNNGNQNDSHENIN
jgi:hypothetical protein